MFETIKRLYNKTNNIDLVKNALNKNWITKDQYYEITRFKIEEEVTEVNE